MRLQIEAEPNELEEKPVELVKALFEVVQSFAPELADQLSKALPRKEPELKYPVLRELQKRTAEAYSKHMQKMLKEIGLVLNSGIEKSDDGDLGDSSRHLMQLHYDHTKPIAEKDDAGYKRVKTVLIGMGHKETDFEEGGILYGKSVNELLDMIREKQ